MKGTRESIGPEQRIKNSNSANQDVRYGIKNHLHELRIQAPIGLFFPEVYDNSTLLILHKIPH